MDCSHALIPLDGKKVHLNPESKAKFTLLKSGDPRAYILFVETGPDTYMCTSSEEECSNLISPNLLNELWTLEFDGSCSNAGSGVGVVLMSPDGYSFPYGYKLEFENTNNTTKYEALLLGLTLAKERGIK